MDFLRNQIFRFLRLSEGSETDASVTDLLEEVHWRAQRRTLFHRLLHRLELWRCLLLETDAIHRRAASI